MGIENCRGRMGRMIRLIIRLYWLGNRHDNETIQQWIPKHTPPAGLVVVVVVVWEVDVVSSLSFSLSLWLVALALFANGTTGPW